MFNINMYQQYVFFYGYLIESRTLFAFNLQCAFGTLLHLDPNIIWSNRIIYIHLM